MQLWWYGCQLCSDAVYYAVIKSNYTCTGHIIRDDPDHKHKKFEKQRETLFHYSNYLFKRVHVCKVVKATDDTPAITTADMQIGPKSLPFW